MRDTHADVLSERTRSTPARIGRPVHEWKGAAPPNRTVMSGRYCRLEPLVATTHARQLFEANAADRDETMWTYLPYGPFRSFDEYHEWVESRSQRADPQFYAVISGESGVPVGVAAYLRIDAANGSIEIGGLAYAPALQATRASTEVAYLLLDRAFELGYRRVEWKCDACNVASRRAAQRFGMSFEGVFRQSSVVKGRNRDTAWYSVLDCEWPPLSAAFRGWLAPTNFTAAGHQLRRLSTVTRALLIATDEFTPELGSATAR